MKSRLLTGEGCVWPEITRAVRAAPRGDAAVAYFGTGGAKRLPLGPGSRLVVDASTASVRNGSTDPRELLTLQEAGVEVFSSDRLHGKVFVVGKTAFIGSANCTRNSASRLQEAVVRTTDPSVVADARAFVIDSCLGPAMGPAELEALAPEFEQAGRQASPAGGSSGRSWALWFEEFPTQDPPAACSERSARSFEAALAERRYTDSTHYVEQIWRTGRVPYQKRDVIVMYAWDRGRWMVSPPGVVIHVEVGRGGRGSVSFTETEHRWRNACSFDRMTASLGRGWKAKLDTDGKLSREDGVALWSWWGKRSR